MQLEKFFEIMDCNARQTASFATFMLKGEVEHWWRAIHGTLQVDDDEPITLDIFERAFQDNYFPESVREAKEVEFMALEQGFLMVL